MNKKIILIASSLIFSNFSYAEKIILPNYTSSAFNYSEQDKNNVNYLYNLMDQGNYSTAQKFIKTKPLSNTMITGILTKYANQGLTPAMWMLGDAYSDDNDTDNTKKWIYTALLGTKIDSSFCINKKAGAIEGVYSKYFYKAVQMARSGDISDAINFAINFQKGVTLSNRKPAWVCAVVEHEKNKTNNNGILEQNKWQDNYKKQMKLFIEETSTDKYNNY